MEDENDYEEEEKPEWTYTSQVIEALNVSRRFFSFEEGEQGAFYHVQALDIWAETADHCFSREAEDNRSFFLLRNALNSRANEDTSYRTCATVSN